MKLIRAILDRLGENPIADIVERFRELAKARPCAYCGKLTADTIAPGVHAHELCVREEGHRLWIRQQIRRELAEKIARAGARCLEPCDRKGNTLPDAIIKGYRQFTDEVDAILKEANEESP